MSPEDKDPAPGGAQAAAIGQGDKARAKAARRRWLSRFVVVLAILTAVLCGLNAYFVVPNATIETMRFWGVAWYGWLESELVLLAIWLGLGSGKILIRAAAVVVQTMLIFAVIVHFYVRFDLQAWLVSSLSHMAGQYAVLVVAIALPLGWMRRTKRIRIVTQEHAPAANHRRSSQFTLAQFLLMITLVGVAFGILPHFGDYAWYITLALSLAVAMHTAIWAVLCVGRTGIRVAIMLAVSILIGVGVALVEFEFARAKFPDIQWSLEDILFGAFNFGYGAKILLETALVAAVLGVIRGFGYRLEWLDRSAANRLPASAASRPDAPGA